MTGFQRIHGDGELAITPNRPLVHAVLLGETLSGFWGGHFVLPKRPIRSDVFKSSV